VTKPLLVGYYLLISLVFLVICGSVLPESSNGSADLNDSIDAGSVAYPESTGSAESVTPGRSGENTADPETAGSGKDTKSYESEEFAVNPKAGGSAESLNKYPAGQNESTKPTSGTTHPEGSTSNSRQTTKSRNNGAPGGTKGIPGIDGGIVFAGYLPVSEGEQSQNRKLSPKVATTLHLTYEKPVNLEDEYSISFTLSFRNGLSSGNILHLENAKYKIDLRFIGTHGDDSAKIQLFFNGNWTHISGSIPYNKIHKGYRIAAKLAVDEAKGLITLNLNDFTRTEKLAPFLADSPSDIFFGTIPEEKLHKSNTVSANKTPVNIFDTLPGNSNCVPMTLRDLQITINGKLEHKYLFNEMDGEIAHDCEGGLDARAVHHRWQIDRHFFWSIYDSITYKNEQFLDVFVDPYKQSLGILTKEGIEHYSIIDGKISKTKYQETRQPQFSVENYPNQNLVSGYATALPDPVTATFDFKNGIRKGDITKDPNDGYIYGGRVFARLRDEAIFAFGGYGWYKTRNQLIKFDPLTKTWNEVKMTGDFIAPRMLFVVLPSEQPDVYYIMGGQGNKTGVQGLGYRNFWDIFRINIDSATCKEVFNWGKNGDYMISESAVWADQSKSSIYSNVFRSDRKFGMKRRIVFLKPGDTTKTFVSDTGLVAGRYPAEGVFFISYQMNRLFSVLADRYDTTTTVKIYSIKTPVLTEEGYKKLYDLTPNAIYKKKIAVLSKWGISFAALLFLPVVPIYYTKRRKRKMRELQLRREAQARVEEFRKENEPECDLVTLFGGLKIFDHTGGDITNGLSPKQKEVLACVMYYSLSGNEANFTELDKLVWEGTHSEKLKNLRNVTLSKIRNTLREYEGIKLLVRGTRLAFSIEDNYKNELESYFLLKRFLKDKRNLQDEESFMNFLKITRRGRFLEGITGEWVEGVRMSEEAAIIEIALNKLDAVFRSGDYEECLRIADSVSVHDPLNEELLGFKLRALYGLGRHSIAVEVYDAFCKKYESLFGEKCGITLQELLKY